MPGTFAFMDGRCKCGRRVGWSGDPSRMPKDALTCPACKPKVPAPPVPQVSDSDLVISLRSVTCPMCGGVKNAGQTTCRGCYSHLTYPEKQALYRRLGNGYSEAVHEAMFRLHVGTFRMPKP